jgi:predicted GIY-YIG superfamily endonuclease
MLFAHQVPDMRDGFHYKFWVYILSSRSGTLYAGITGFFERRIHQHKYDSIEGFTKKYQVQRLGVLRELPGRTGCYRTRKAGEALAPGKEDRVNPETESTLARLG